MSYCLNPNCSHPTNNSISVKFCTSCGSKLLLAERYRATKQIGQGGFGKTFLALDEYKPSQPRCVIKQFLSQAQGTNNIEKASELFKVEASLGEISERSDINVIDKLSSIIEGLLAKGETQPSVPIADKLLLTVPEAQALTGLSKDVLRDAIQEGMLKAKLIGRSWRIKRSDLDEFVASLF